MQNGIPGFCFCGDKENSRVDGSRNQRYHDAKVQLSDADFVLEDTESIMIMEYKNANTKKAAELSYKTKPFNPMELMGRFELDEKCEAKMETMLSVLPWI